MKAGELEIEGSIDSREIIAGLDRIANALENTKAKGNNVNSSMSLLSSTASSVAKQFLIISSVGVGAITALASKAPAVAPALAKMSIELMKIQNALGEGLRPAFEAIADELLPKIGEAIEKNNGLIGSFADIAAQGVTDLGNAVSGNTDQIKNLFPKTGMMAIGAAIGFKLLGPTGLFLGAALGYAAEQAVIPEDKTLAEAAKDSAKTAREDFSGTNQTGKDLIGSGDYIVTPFMAINVSAGKSMVSAIMNYISKALNNFDSKQAGMTSGEMVVG